MALREELRTKCIRLGVSLGCSALTTFMFIEESTPRPLTAIATALSLGQAAHDALKGHALGQEIAAIEAARVTARQKS